MSLLKKMKTKKSMMPSLLVLGYLSLSSAVAASVCTDSASKLVFNDSNITGNGAVWVAGYNNGSWMWSSELTCTAGQCVSNYTYNGGQVEFRVEGPGVSNYYSPGPGQEMHAAVTPAACGSSSGTGNGSGTGNDSGTGNGSGTGNDSGTGNGSGTGNDSGTGNGSGTGNDSGTGNGSGTGNDSGTGNGSGTGNDSGTGNGSSTSTVEAESGSAYGGARTYQDTHASGGSGIAYISSQGAGFSVSNVPASSQMVITYASQQSGKISVNINDVSAGDISFSSTGNWTVNYSTASLSATIPANAKVDVFYDSGDAALNVDKIEFTTSGDSGTGNNNGSGNSNGNGSSAASKPAIPNNGQQYYILGQDRQSITDYHAVAGLPKPYGYTVYVTLARGEPSYDNSYCFKGLDGLKNTGNYSSNTAAGCASGDTHRQNHWGSGEQNVEWVISTYNPELVSIGLWCPNNGNMPALYNNNAYDDLLTELADFFKANSSTKFLLRTCYEFNGDAGGWSDVNFRNTFKYVRTFLDGKNVENVAHVWQSDAYHGTGRGTSALGNTEQGYWPGKQYVDWVGVSQFDSDIAEEANIAVAEGLPLFIAEATPHGALFHQYDFKLQFNTTGSSPDGSVTLHNDLNWFNAKDDEIYQDVMKAWAYINADWSSQPQWSNAADQAGENYFKYSDTRVQKNATIQNHFENMVTTSNGFILGQ